MQKNLSGVVNWGQQLLQEVLVPGDFAIDLTAGNGYDTLMLARSVGSTGRVLAFDLQERALANTAARLGEHGIAVHRPASPQSLCDGANLVQGCHSGLDAWCECRPRAIIGNLGYLPGGDRALVTRPATTLGALAACCRQLAPGGRLALVVYTGHPGGTDEAAAVDRFLAGLDNREYEVLRLAVANRPQAPFLLVAGRRRD